MVKDTQNSRAKLAEYLKTTFSYMLECGNTQIKARKNKKKGRYSKGFEEQETFVVIIPLLIIKILRLKWES